MSGLTNGTTYTFKVSATNSVGTGSASAASNPATPGVLDHLPVQHLRDPDPEHGRLRVTAWPVNLGMAFTTDTNGYITGARFYKAATNTGTHVGSLWSAHRDPAGPGHLHRRDGLGLAAGDLLDARWR